MPDRIPRGVSRRFAPSFLRFLLCAAALAVVPPLAAQGAAPVDMSLPALPLQDALLRLGQSARVTIISAPALTAGKQVSAVHLQGTVAQALRQLLQGSGLRAVPNVNGEGYRIESVPAGGGVATLSPVTVSARLGDAGPLALDSGVATKTGTPLLETAQSVSVVNRELMDMIGATTTAEALRYSAGVSVGGMAWTAASTRLRCAAFAPAALPTIFIWMACARLAAAAARRHRPPSSTASGWSGSRCCVGRLRCCMGRSRRAGWSM
ncbi:ferric siderophore receptor [Bordetella trematum]|nr:ferric siderophore receptor [Bordetella trematum]